VENIDEIEIIYDDTDKTYHAIWRPPLSIGAGSNEMEALEDMKEVILFCVDEMIKTRNLRLPNSLEQ
jgi:predicted RNase H-like HicB family nuclease